MITSLSAAGGAMAGVVAALGYRCTYVCVKKYDVRNELLVQKWQIKTLKIFFFFFLIRLTLPPKNDWFRTTPTPKVALFWAVNLQPYSAKDIAQCINLSMCVHVSGHYR